MTGPSGSQRVQHLLRGARTFSAEAGFTLRDKPSPLWQLVVLSVVLAKPISADLSVAAARELRRAGGNTPKGMLALTWQQRVDACVRAHYRRFDESTATRMEQAASFVEQRWSGDLRRLADEADGDVARTGRLLEEIPGLGPAGADIFRREAQAVWPWLRPFFDQRVRAGAKAARLPPSVSRLAELVESEQYSVLAAVLVRVELDAG